MDSQGMHPSPFRPSTASGDTTPLCRQTPQTGCLVRLCRYTPSRSGCASYWRNKNRLAINRYKNANSTRHSMESVATNDSVPCRDNVGKNLSAPNAHKSRATGETTNPSNADRRITVAPTAIFNIVRGVIVVRCANDA